MSHHPTTVPTMSQNKLPTPLAGTLHSGRPAPTISTPPLDMGPTLISEQGATLDGRGLGDTLAGSPSAEEAVGLASTLVQETSGLDSTLADPNPPKMTREPANRGVHRSTMLPKLSGSLERPHLIFEARPRFETVSTLGQGGMGVVELVKDHDIGRTVAVKRMTSGIGDPITVARFVEEVGTVGRLEHPNIVPIYDAGVDEQGRYFFVMKKLDGETLEDIITLLRSGDAAAHARYTFEARVQIFMGILRALEYSHARQIIHRDLKPANIMVGPYGEVVLMDWGIAKQVGTMGAEEGISENELFSNPAEARERLLRTRHGALLGTPAYMSPEQAEGMVHKLDERTDLYSACVVMHELLTLEHYLGTDHPSLMAMLHSVMHKEVSFKEAACPGAALQEPLPSEWTYFLKRGMHKDPEQRFKSAREMALEIERMQSGNIHVQCGVTLSRRGMSDMMRMINHKNPIGMMLGGALHVAYWIMPRGFEERYPRAAGMLVFAALSGIPLILFTAVWTAVLVSILT
jgi:eukaryotic-like serine/threonine-protein kinase